MPWQRVLERHSSCKCTQPSVFLAFSPADMAADDLGTRVPSPLARPSPQGAILDKVKVTLALDKDDPAKEDAVKALRKDINAWVAKYRREPKVSGKPSFG